MHIRITFGRLRFQGESRPDLEDYRSSNAGSGEISRLGGGEFPAIGARMSKGVLTAQRIWVLLGLLFLAFQSSRGEIIPPARRITWQGNVGVPGGIPTRTT